MDWAIDASRPKTTVTIDHLERCLWNKPNRKVFAQARELFPDTYLGLCGFSLELYEKKFGTAPRMTGVMMREFAKDMKTWLDDEGTVIVAKTIELLYKSKNLDWISDPVWAPFNREFRYRRLAPVVDRELSKRAGEQAEWSGSSGSEYRVVAAEL